MKRNLLLIIIINLFIIKSLQQKLLLNKTNCNDKRLEEIDRQFIRLIGIGNGGRSYPTNKSELNKFCKENDKIFIELENFLNECLNNDASSVSKIFIYSTKRYWKILCNKKRQKKQQKLLQTTQCFNTIINKIDCIDIFANRTRNLIPYRIGSEKINHICCNQIELMNCAERSLSIPCMDEKGRETLMELFRNIKGDIVNYGCGDYNEHTDLCDKLKPLKNEQLDKTIKINYRLRSYFFAILFAIDSQLSD